MERFPISLNLKTHRVQGARAPSELLQGFYNFGHHRLSGDWTFQSWNQYILWKRNRSNTVQTAEGPFGFLIHVTDQAPTPPEKPTPFISCLLWKEDTLILSRLHLDFLSTHIKLLQFPNRPNYFKKIKLKASLTGALIDYSMQCSDFCHVYKGIVSHRLSVTLNTPQVRIWMNALFLTWIVVDK